MTKDRLTEFKRHARASHKAHMKMLEESQAALLELLNLGINLDEELDIDDFLDINIGDASSIRELVEYFTFENEGSLSDICEAVYRFMELNSDD